MFPDILDWGFAHVRNDAHLADHQAPPLGALVCLLLSLTRLTLPPFLLILDSSAGPCFRCSLQPPVALVVVPAAMPAAALSSAPAATVEATAPAAAAAAACGSCSCSSSSSSSSSSYSSSCGCGGGPRAGGTAASPARWSGSCGVTCSCGGCGGCGICGSAAPCCGCCCCSCGSSSDCSRFAAVLANVSRCWSRRSGGRLFCLFKLEIPYTPR